MASDVAPAGDDNPPPLPVASGILGGMAHTNPRWLVPALAVSFVLATLGTVLISLVPHLTEITGIWRAAYVIVVLVAFKAPLIGILWWLIATRMERPDRPAVWSADEQRQIIARLKGEAAGTDDHRQLAHLAREAWHVADRCSDGPDKADAVELALSLGARAHTSSRTFPAR